MSQLWENSTAKVISEEATEYNVDPSCYQHLAVDSFENGGIAIASKVNAALNVAIAVIAAVANVLVFPAIRKSNFLRTPSKLLLCNLVVTDIGVALVAQPFFAYYLLVKSQGFSRTSCYLISFGAVFGAALSDVSLMTMSAISMDRYIAFRFHLKYRQTVTARRVCAVIGVIWLLAVLNAQTWLWDRVLYGTVVFINVPIQFVVTCSAYISIYRGLRRHPGQWVQDRQAKVETAQPMPGNTLNIAKYRRSASSMMWIYGIFILCYLPYVCAETVVHFSDSVLVTCLTDFAITIVYTNSCLNPFVYCLRLPEIRAAVLRRIRRICGRRSRRRAARCLRDKRNLRPRPHGCVFV